VKKTKDLIVKYAEYRGKFDDRLTLDLLIRTFSEANAKERGQYIKEMKTYIELVDSGKLEKGLPVVVSELTS